MHSSDGAAEKAPWVSGIFSYLRQVRRLWLAGKSAHLGLWFGGVALIWLSMGPWLYDHSQGRGALIVWTLGFAGLLALYLLFSQAIPRYALARPEDIASFIGREKPEVGSDLLSALEFSNGTQPSSSEALISAHATHTLERLETLPPDFFRHEVVTRPLKWFAGAVMVLVASAVYVFPGAYLKTFGYFLELAEAPPQVLHSPVPLFSGLTVNMKFPAYMKREAVTLENTSGEFRAPKGSTISLRGKATRGFTTAHLLLKIDDVEQKPFPLSHDDGNWQGELSFTGRTTYQFSATDSERRIHIDTFTRIIELEPDRIPTVELLAPADVLEVSATKRIELALSAEDDYGLDHAELVCIQNGSEKTFALPMTREVRSFEHKWNWDLTELAVKPGERVEYFVRVRDTADVLGFQTGRSRSYFLEVTSPAEKHEAFIAKLEAMVQAMIAVLASRLTLADPIAEEIAGEGATDPAAASREALGALALSLHELKRISEKDELSDKSLKAALADSAKAFDSIVQKMANKETEPLQKQLITRLEDDTLLFVDWVSRERLSAMLSSHDEVSASQERLAKLFAEFKRTGSEEVKREIERELKALEQKLAQASQKLNMIPQDVMDQFVHREAVENGQKLDCLATVRSLMAAGDMAGAEKKMAECNQSIDDAEASLEQSLAELRDDKFNESEKQFQALRNELADLAKEQGELSDDIAILRDRYREKVSQHLREMDSEQRQELLDLSKKLERKLAEVSQEGMGEYERDELTTAKQRAQDVKRLLGSSDFAEALSMAREVTTGLENASDELERQLEGTSSKGLRSAMEQAEQDLEGAKPTAQKLIRELEQTLPNMNEMLGQDSLQRLSQMEKRQNNLAQRAKSLAENAKSAGQSLPGKSQEALEQGLSGAESLMKSAAGRMRGKDPQGAAEQAKAAKQMLESTGKSANSAARMQSQQGGSGMRDEPIRIPGAAEYKPPVQFREKLQDAMRKQELAPQTYRDLVKRYYQELSR